MEGVEGVQGDSSGRCGDGRRCGREWRVCGWVGCGEGGGADEGVEGGGVWK